MKLKLAILLLLGLGLPLPAGAQGPLSDEPLFQQHIQPLLKARCIACHGDQKRSAGLDLTAAEQLARGGESGPAVVAGDPDESPLYQRVLHGEMPPEDSGVEPLTPEDIELVRRWIAAGAKMPRTTAESPLVTDQQIVPLMWLRCSACHGGRRREADLDLRTLAGMLKGGKSGPAVVAGKPAESLIVQRIHAEEMPPRRQLVSVSVKPMESNELKLLEQWIAAGMPTAAPQNEAEQPPLVSDEDRAFWSFQPPRAVVPPVESLTPEDRQWVRSPIDVFVLAKLREQKLSPSAEADRAALIRRLSFDLIGLPPTAEEVQQFVEDRDPFAYEALVERLLASPHYGERWGRHWLDAAGYADSEGAQNEDRVRPNMWRYRDYVVRAFNRDKPYDRFLHEQIAGDELADYERAEVITPEIYDNLVATGFLRTAPDRTFANITNFVPDRLEVIADEIQILGSSVLGLTIQCSRCHSHKFDPLPQRDYFRLAALLKDALDEHDWIGPEERQLNYVTREERLAWQQHEQQIDTRVAPLKQQLESAVDDAAKKALEQQISAIEAARRPEPKIRALWSRGDPSPTYVLRRGNYLTPGDPVEPGVPQALAGPDQALHVEPPWPSAKTTGRRLALARWLTESDHPLTGRVIVNRVWKHHFGAGIVTTLDNFGRTGAAPSHPELLDWLAVELVRSGWSLKALHRLMVTSSTYRQSSHVAAEHVAADPENRWLARMPLRRLEAEIIRDTLLTVAGRLDRTPFGPPDDVDVRGDGLVTVKATGRGERRSIYVLHRRTKLPTILENFDSPQMSPNCLERDVSIAAPQALHLLNNAAVRELAERFAQRVVADAGADPDAQIVRAYELAFGVRPDAEQHRVSRDLLDQLIEQWRRELGEQPESRPAHRALTNYCHALMNSAAFIYID